MSDYKRVWLEGGTYFFTVTLADRRKKLLTENFDFLTTTIKKIKQQRPFKLHGWVILPDHLHCIWTLPKNDCDYSGRWRAIKKLFTRHIRNQNSKSSEPIWQQRFWEHTIRNKTDFEKHFDYIHINPLKHGYVKRVRDWPYSSFHFYVEKGRLDINWGNNFKNIELSETGERIGLKEFIG